MLFIIGVYDVSGQYYGLYFNSNDSRMDQRTGLDLSDKDYLSFRKDFEISFDIMLRSAKKAGFGYILRIVGSEGNNIDIIYDQITTKNDRLIVTCGQKLSTIAVNIDKLSIVDQWETLTLKVDLNNDILVFAYDDSSYIEKEIGFMGEKKFKFLFGANDFSFFETTNVPPMNIRDIMISSRNRLSYHWTLQENSGEYARDEIKSRRSAVKNPIWLNMKHMQWELEKKIACLGRAELLLSKQKDSVFILSESEFVHFDLNSPVINRITLPEPIINIEAGCCLFQKREGSEFLLINSANRKVLSFNPSTLRQVVVHSAVYSDSCIYHQNIFRDVDDQEILFFSGFGGSHYLNRVSKYDVKKNRWSILKTSGDTLFPRYLAAMGVNYSRDTLFFLGGYGSKTGSPIINPHYYSDLYSFSINDSSFHLINGFNSLVGPKGFANSMVIDSQTNCFYALQFNPFLFESNLQLIKASFSELNWDAMADKISYKYEESASFADLFYNKDSQKLFAVTSFYNDSINLSTTNIYSILFPPGLPYEKVLRDETKKRMWIWIILIITIDLIVIFYISFRKRRAKKSARNIVNGKNQSESAFFSTDLLKETWDLKSGKQIAVMPPGRIYLFGGFRVHLSEEQEVSNKFSPVLKELFLMILLNTTTNKNGVSTKTLLEQIWGDMSLKNAKNNLSVNINKLRTILGSEFGLLIKSDSGFWKFDFEGAGDTVFCDYWECWKILKSENKHSESHISMLVNLLQRGGLLLNTSYEWLDSFRAKISHEIIDLLVSFSLEQGSKSNPDFAIKIADAIFLFDMINEEAMVLKCKALVRLGKHSMSKDVYSKFSKEYQILYDIPFHRSFREIVE